MKYLFGYCPLLGAAHQTAPFTSNYLWKPLQCCASLHDMINKYNSAKYCDKILYASAPIWSASQGSFSGTQICSALASF